MRFIELEVLVDTCASLLCLPKSKIVALGLVKIGSRQVTTANGQIQRDINGSARLTIFNRTFTVDAIELTEDIPSLPGYIPLENLDLTPNQTKEVLKPAHGDEIIYCVSTAMHLTLTVYTEDWQKVETLVKKHETGCF